MPILIIGFMKKWSILNWRWNDSAGDLNGRWRFSYSENPSLRLKDFYKEDFDVSGFKYIEVPGHIQLQGYDKCQYINTMYPWEGHDELRPPNISKTYNPVGSYVTFFNVKEE